MKHSNLERLHSMRSSFKVWKQMKPTQNFVIKKNRRYNLRFNLTFKVCKFTMSMAWIKFVFEILDMYVVSISSRWFFCETHTCIKIAKSNITELQCFCFRKTFSIHKVWSRLRHCWEKQVRHWQGKVVANFWQKMLHKIFWIFTSIACHANKNKKRSLIKQLFETYVGIEEDSFVQSYHSCSNCKRSKVYVFLYVTNVLKDEKLLLQLQASTKC